MLLGKKSRLKIHRTGKRAFDDRTSCSLLSCRFQPPHHRGRKVILCFDVTRDYTVQEVCAQTQRCTPSSITLIIQWNGNPTWSESNRAGPTTQHAFCQLPKRGRGLSKRNSLWKNSIRLLTRPENLVQKPTLNMARLTKHLDIDIFNVEVYNYKLKG